MGLSIELLISNLFLKFIKLIYAICLLYFIKFLSESYQEILTLDNKAEKAKSAFAWYLTLLWDFFLLLFFIIQHSYLASLHFKFRYAALFPETTSRSTYALCTVLHLWVIRAAWLPTYELQLWRFTTSKTLFCAIFFTTILLLIWKTLNFDHFELLGLSQTYTALRGLQERGIRQKPGMQRTLERMRHPVLISAALLCFTVPTLRYDRFLCGVVLITYMLVRNKVDYLDTRHTKREIKALWEDLIK
ncbi:nurim-like [Zophobas morio]|uniref:nurim-like n=1 Tax=Zophobas morio TaxID=2755281 RepID=UPI0030834C02